MKYFLELSSKLRVTFWDSHSVGLDAVHIDYNCGDECWRSMAIEGILNRFHNFSVSESFNALPNINFRFDVTERVKNYSFGLVDLLRGTVLWSAPIKGEYTDVEFLVDSNCFVIQRVV